MTPNELHAIDALEHCARNDKGVIEVDFGGVSLRFLGTDALDLVRLIRRMTDTGPKGSYPYEVVAGEPATFTIKGYPQGDF